MRDPRSDGNVKGEQRAASAGPAPDSFAVQAPTIGLPKGGGAIRGIGEKFAANPVTGTGSMSIPIYTSPGRAGFGPKLALSYDSGAGNGPFGFGWSLSIPAITRKTDKGLPRYRDADDSDVFILGGAEDLVPELGADGKIIEKLRDGYRVRRYFPRVEGSFARIERWSRPGDTYWRSISRDNVTTMYGKTDGSRIFDPADRTRIFSWLVCETWDDKGNAAVYSYAPETAEGVDRSRPHEQKRDRARTTARYPQRIQYGNQKPCASADDLAHTEWLFEVVFDYGEGYWERLSSTSVRASPSPEGSWPARPDAFSSYRAGFEVRTYRRCRRVLMFHRFPELGADPYLVRSTELDYHDLDYATVPTIEAELAHQGSTRFASFLCTVTQCGHVQDATQLPVDRGGAHYLTYLTRSLPPIDLDYSRANIDEEVREVDRESLENLPIGLDGARYQWVDLDGEGLSGVLTEQAGTWYYKRNLAAIGSASATPRFGPLEQLRTMPAPANLAGGQQLLDLSGNGRLDVVQFGGVLPGYFERTPDAGWEPFTPFVSAPNISFEDPNLKLVDLTGDGHADLLITDDGVFTWYPSLAEKGFGAAERVHQGRDEELGPHLVFADGSQSIYLADMSGDGLGDLVRIRNGEVCYWPSLGYGRFGAKITMDQSPWFDAPDRFDHRRLRLADIDGSGTVDLLYLEPDGVSIYFNRSGNSFSARRKLTRFPRIDNLSSVTVVDLLGNGTACLVWSSPLAGDGARPMRYIDLMGGQKPHLLISVKNNLGAETRVEYAPSTKFYLADKLAGTPWITRLPFPVHCVERVTVTDAWRKTSFSTTYSYHHGYFDGVEREFRGFGRVEQVDIESFGEFAAGNSASPYITPDNRLYQPPVKTITWFHTGASLDRVPDRRTPDRVLSHYEGEYFRPEVPGGFREHVLPEPALPEGLTSDEQREALRACKGSVLRQEVYELDIDVLDARGEHRPVRLFTTAFHNCHIQCLQRRGTNPHAVFLATESEAITYHYDLDLRAGELNPDPRVAHTLNLAVDRFGNVLQSIAVAYGRHGRHDNAGLPPRDEEQIANVQRGERHLVYTERRFTDVIDDDRDHRLPAPCEVMTYELTGVAPGPASSGIEYFDIAELRKLALGKAPASPAPPGTPVPVPVRELAYHELPTGAIEKRLVEHVRTLYFDATVTGPLGLGEQGPRGLPYETYKLALTEGLLSRVFDDKLTPALRDELATPARSGYSSGALLASRFGPQSAGQYWIRSGVAELDAARFYLPTAYVDAFGNRTQVTYVHDLLVASVTDAMSSTTSVDTFDFRVLAPARIKDINDNVSAVLFDALGTPAAVALTAGGDDLTDVDPAPLLQRVTDFFTATYDEAEARRLLGNATARHLYHFGERLDPDGSLSWGHHPASASSILRERHIADLPAGGRLQTAFEYSDGTGAVLVKKAKAEPAPGTTAPRWIAGGKTVLNNKGKPVKQYEPYFSSNEHRFEELAEVGVTPVMYYDAIGRLIRTESPDGSYRRVEFSPWHVASYDANDTVGEPGNAWYAKHAEPAGTTEMQRAASLAKVHAGTPAITFLDSLGRDVIAVQHDRFQYPGDPAPSAGTKHVTFTKLDAEGKPLWIRDARGNLVMQYIQPPMPDSARTDATTGFAPCYDIAGNLLFQHSMDSGDRWILNDAVGKPLFAWDVNERAGQREDRFAETRYDALHRPTELWLQTNGGAAELIARFEYGEGIANDRARNLRGQLHAHYDPSGLSRVVEYDFAGRSLEVQRQLASAYTVPRIDWRTAQLEDETFTQITKYDALGRIQLQYNWHRANDRVAVYEPHYNDRGLLDSEALVVRATKTSDGHTEGPSSKRTQVIEAITYNAKGQREAIRYGNGTRTRFTYDPQTFRLVQLRTTRPGYDPAFPSAVAQFKNAEVVQNLYYTYDPVGNITEIYDDAFRPAFFANQEIEPQARYTYDALYRLIEATGREHAAAGAPGPGDALPLFPSFPVPKDNLADQRRYTQRYRYDTVGNILQMAHTATNGWTRNYEYTPNSNRLARTWFGDDTLNATVYAHDTHGNMLSLANIAPAGYLQWDHRDMIQVLEQGGGGRVYYQYDASKQRTRKVSETQDRAKAWERIYLGGMEIYRRYAGGDVAEETETHHLFGGEHRVLLVEDVIKTNRPRAPLGPLYRYQYGNHLGSSCLELDDQAGVISYEEYHPYGTSAYRAARSHVEAPKRYRFTGMERDEEGGLSYHKARYFAPLLGRWSCADPQGLADGPNVYAYAHDNPLTLVDIGGCGAEKLGPDDIEAARAVLRLVPALAPAAAPVAAAVASDLVAMTSLLLTAGLVAGAMYLANKSFEPALEAQEQEKQQAEDRAQHVLSQYQNGLITHEEYLAFRAGGAPPGILQERRGDVSGAQPPPSRSTSVPPMTPTLESAAQKSPTVTSPQRLLPAGRPTARTEKQVAKVSGTGQQRGTVHNEFMAELYGATGTAMATALGTSIPDAISVDSTRVMLLVEGKNYLLYVGTKGLQGGRLQEVQLSPRLAEQADKYRSLIAAARSRGEAVHVQYDFIGAPPSAEFKDYLLERGLSVHVVVGHGVSAKESHR